MYALQKLWLPWSCHVPEHVLQKNWFVPGATDPAVHALQLRSLDAVPLTEMREPALQFCQYPHGCRPATAVNVGPAHAAHTESTVPSQPPVNPDPAEQLVHPPHVLSVVVLPANVK